MKKLLIVIIVLGINAAGILLLLPESPFHMKKQTVYIALAGPMSGNSKENGEAMLRGVNMYLETVRNSSRFKDKKIELLVYNDKDKRTAISIASKIADEGKALLVIGHYDSDGSAAAGSIYRKNGIPAVTASATSENVTQDNEWYFRVIPGNLFTKSFIGYGIKNLLGSSSASIIYDKNDYGISLAEGFEAEAGKMEITIRNKWSFDSEADNLDHELHNIIGDLRATEKPGTIFCATHGAEGVRFFASCRYPGTDYTVVGPESFSSPAFISQFNDYPQEQMSPGYYTDGIYAVSPFISYLADQENARIFRWKFVRKYGKEPSWVEACYYDAADVAFRAIERAEIQGQDIREDRRRVRKALAGFNERDIAVKGVTGDIYFDKMGNVTRPLAIGVWNKHIFLPTYTQFQGILPNSLSDKKDESGKESPGEQERENQESGEDIIEIGGQAMTYLRIVHAGLDINTISNIDTEKGSFTADFYLWFRFRGDFDDTGIRFTNALNPVSLGRPVMEERSGDIRTRAYRVIAAFTADFDRNAYPLDQHTLRIRLCNKKQTRKELIYVPDVVGLPLTAGKADKKKMMLKDIPGWDTIDISYFQDIEKTPGTGKEMLSFSRFNTDIRIQREGRLSLLLKYVFPLFVIAVILYITFLLPPDIPELRMFTFIPVLLIIAGIRLLYGYLLPGQGLMGNIFSAICVLTVFSVMVSAAVHIMHRHNAAGKVMIINRTGKVLYVFLALAGLGLFIYSYCLSFFLQQ